jgi:hypothetical protein
VWSSDHRLPHLPKNQGLLLGHPLTAAEQKYRYCYYPSHYVYYDTGRGVYFYLAGDEWHVSAHLPSGIRLEYADYVAIELDTDEPYVYFPEHKKKYLPGKMKKIKHKKKWSSLDQKQDGRHRVVAIPPVVRV